MRRLGSGVAACVLAATGIAYLLGSYVGRQKYPEFIVGNLAWNLGVKSSDLLALPVGIAIAAAVYVCVETLLDRVARVSDPGCANELASGFVVASLPAMVGIANYFVYEGTPLEWFYVSSAATIVLAFSAYRGTRLGRVDLVETHSAAAFVVLASFVPVAGALVLRLAGRLSPGASESIVATAVHCLAAATALQLLIAWKRPRWVTQGRLLALVQVALPAIFLSMLPTRAIDATGRDVTFVTSPIVMATAVAFAALAYVELFLVVRRVERGAHEMVLAPTALFALVVLFRAGTSRFPEIIPDDYHGGEHILAGFRVARGAFPYVGYMSPHGTVEDDLASILAYMLFDGTAATVDEAGRYLWSSIAFVAFHATYRSTRSLVLAFTSTLFTAGRLGWLFFVPFVSFWVAGFTKLPPLRYVAAFILTSVLVVFGLPSQGALLVAAFAPLAAYQAYRAFVADRRGASIAIGGMLVALVCFLLSPLGRPIVHALEFLASNAAVNGVAYGVTWAQSRSVRPIGGLVWETLRVGWVIAPLAAIGVARKYRKDVRVVLTAAAIVIFSLLLVPYTMGRIDANSPSRTGVYTIWALYFLVPFLLSLAVDRVRMHTAMAGCIAFASLLAPPFALSAMTEATRPVLHGGVVVDGARLGLPGLGVGVVDTAHLARLRRVAREIRDVVPRNGRYLDLTNRSALHAYLRLAPVIPTPAPYNMSAQAHHDEAITFIERSRPAIALLYADNLVNDGGTLSLRDHALFRYVLAHYVPYADGELVFARRDDRAAGQRVGLDDRTDAEWRGGLGRTRAAVRLGDLALVHVLRTGDRIRFRDGTTRTVMQAPSEAASAEDADVVLLDGAPLDGAKLGAPHDVRVLLDDARRDAYRVALWSRIYANPELSHIASSWGHSFRSLEAHMRRTVDLTRATTTATSASRASAIEWRNHGARTELTIRLSRPLAGADAGLLRFRFHCGDSPALTRMRVSFTTDVESEFDESRSLQLTASPGTLIVPLDSHPRWILARRIDAIRIDVDTPSDCPSMQIEDLALWNRIDAGPVRSASH